jgi:dynein heavy chain, axonemal
LILILFNIKRWPLLIDPQGQAIHFLKNRGGDKIEIINENSKNLIKHIEFGISLGRWVVVSSDQDELDS